MNSQKRIVITGAGVLASNGIGKDQFWSAITNGISGIKEITRFDTSAFPVHIAGELKDFNVTDWTTRKNSKRMDYFTQYGVAASRMAVEDARLRINPRMKDRVGVIIGTAIAGISFAEGQYSTFLNKGHHHVSAYTAISLDGGSCPSQISIELGVTGPSMTIATACASGSDVLGYAIFLIQSGRTDIVIAGGAEAPITPFSLGCLCNINTLSRRNKTPEKASRPFDKLRDGFVLAEGAGMLVLENLDHALERGASIYAELLGYASTTDAYHMTRPEPNGREMARAIAMALKNANISPEDIDYVSAHGTSTLLNDEIETIALKDVFGEHAKNGLMVSSIKSTTGHTLGAAGAIELVASAMTIKNGVVPPTCNYQEPDPKCDLDYVPNTKKNKNINYAISNSFGFGGKNGIAVLGKFNGD